jgi:hypothetical protein
MLHCLKNNEVKIYGLPRSGTNFLEFMLIYNLHLNVALLKEGWKHGVATSNIPGISIIRNPFDWLFSIYNFAIKREKIFHIPSDISFFDFLKREYIWDADISGVGSQKVFQRSKNPIHHWNGMNSSWLKKTFFVKYEDLLNNPKESLISIKDYLKTVNVVSHLSNSFVWPDSYLKPGNVKFSNISGINSFSPKDCRSSYSEEMIYFVRSELDFDLVKFFNYS